MLTLATRDSQNMIGEKPCKEEDRYFRKILIKIKTYTVLLYVRDSDCVEASSEGFADPDAPPLLISFLSDKEPTKNSKGAESVEHLWAQHWKKDEKGNEMLGM